MSLFETDGRLASGYHELAVWPFYSFNPQFTGMDPFLGSFEQVPLDKTCKIIIQFDSYSKDVFYTIRDRDIMNLMKFPLLESKKDKEKEKPLNTEELVIVNSVLSRDPVDPPMSENEKFLMVRARDYLKEVPNSLTYYLLAIDW